MKSVTLPAYAKVNLYLDVLGKRPDGYHELLTLFERVDLADEVTIELKPGKQLELECNHPAVPRDGTNLSLRAAETYQQAAGWFQGLRIVLKKRIPVAGGMGGGSSNAAATLHGLQMLSGEALPKEKLFQLANGLGADVAFLLAQVPWALGRGRGDQIEPLSLSTRLWHLLIAPGFPIPTKAVYQAFALTAPGPDVRLLEDALRSSDLPRVRGLLFNALEPTVEALYPAIRHVKATVEKKAGLPRPMVSGSGSTVFVVCASQEEAEEGCRALKKREPRWDLFVASTCPVVQW